MGKRRKVHAAAFKAKDLPFSNFQTRLPGGLPITVRTALKQRC